MPVLRNTILRLMPRSWREDAERSSRQWMGTCQTCGTVTSMWDLGGLRWRAAGKPVTLLRCPTCQRPRMHRFELK